MAFPLSYTPPLGYPSPAPEKNKGIKIVDSPRPENDEYEFEDNLEFMECDTCRAKPGCPVLCHGCLHNRAAINNLRKKRKHLKRKLKSQK